MELKNVTIGDYFYKGKHQLCAVIDFEEVRSMSTGKVTSYKCKAVDALGLSSNEFEVAFSTVVRNRVDVNSLTK